MVNWFTRPMVLEQSFDVIDLVAYCNHMRWLKLRTDNLKTDLRGWKDTFAAHLSVFHVIGWGKKMGEPQGDSEERKTMPCRTCKQPIEQPLIPVGFYGCNVLTSRWNRGWIPPDVIDGNWMAGSFEEHAEYPLLDMDWRTTGEPSANAVNFLSLAEGEFNPQRAQELAELGDTLVRECRDGIRYAARQVQEIEMRRMHGQVAATEELLKFDPTMRNKLVQIHTRGDLPHFHGAPPEGTRRSGLPYEPSKTMEMVENIWKDVRNGRVLAITSKVAGPDAPLIATPTTTALKKLPGRSISNDFRIISDLRYTNLFCAKSDFPEVKITDICLIAERAVSVKRKWPNLSDRCAKRDIDSAPKRIRVHPDMSLILCTEFSGKFADMEPGETVIFLYLVIPFGWLDSP